MLGEVICVNYQHLTPQMPMLARAPFLDSMLTRNIPLQLNATEVLPFFERIFPETPECVMNLVYPETLVVPDYEWDWWEGLPPDFIKGNYREPRVPFSTSVPRWICSFRHIGVIVPTSRFPFFRGTLVPSRPPKVVLWRPCVSMTYKLINTF